MFISKSSFLLSFFLVLNTACASSSPTPSSAANAPAPSGLGKIHASLEKTPDGSVKGDEILVSAENTYVREGSQDDKTLHAIYELLGKKSATSFDRQKAAARLEAWESLETWRAYPPEDLIAQIESRDLGVFQASNDKRESELRLIELVAEEKLRGIATAVPAAKKPLPVWHYVLGKAAFVRTRGGKEALQQFIKLDGKSKLATKARELLRKIKSFEN